MSRSWDYCQTWIKRKLIKCVALLFVLVTVALSVPADVMVKVNEKYSPSQSLLERAKHPRTLVVVTAEDEQHNSKFIGLLRNTGHLLTVSHFNSSSSFPEMTRYGESLYDNLVLILSEDHQTARNTKDKSGSHTNLVGEAANHILQFIENQSGNLMILGSSGNTSITTTLASRVIQRLSVENITLPVQDYFENYEKNRFIIKGLQSPTTETLFSSLQSPVSYEGVAHLLSDQNLLAFPLLHASPTAFIENPQGHIISSGSSLVLVFALQTRANSRIVVSGSSSLCSDRMAQISPSNLPFCQEISEWNFQRRGIVDWSNIYHRKIDSATTSSMYRIYDDVEFQVNLHQLSQYSKWLPFNQSTSMQVEYSMLDPHWRVFLHHAKKDKSFVDNSVTNRKSYVPGIIPHGDSTYAVAFKCPDRYGIFKFVLRLTQKGLSFIHLEVLAPSRNFKHNDYERFLWVAFPYYASTFGVLTLAVIFSILFMRMSTKLKKD